MLLMTSVQPLPIFIGYDPRERAATNVLIDSLYQHSSIPLAITPLVTPQLESQGLYWRVKDPKQSTAFSFTRFLVPHLMDYHGWALFLDCDMLCRADIKALWDQRDDRYGAMCVQHEHVPGETVNVEMLKPQKQRHQREDLIGPGKIGNAEKCRDRMSESKQDCGCQDAP